jgi:hypothetical protein
MTYVTRDADGAYAIWRTDAPPVKNLAGYWMLDDGRPGDVQYMAAYRFEALAQPKYHLEPGGGPVEIKH